MRNMRSSCMVLTECIRGKERTASSHCHVSACRLSRIFTITSALHALDSTALPISRSNHRQLIPDSSHSTLRAHFVRVCLQSEFTYEEFAVLLLDLRSRGSILGDSNIWRLLRLSFLSSTGVRCTGRMSSFVRPLPAYMPSVEEVGCQGYQHYGKYRDPYADSNRCTSARVISSAVSIVCPSLQGSGMRSNRFEARSRSQCRLGCPVARDGCGVRLCAPDSTGSDGSYNDRGGGHRIHNNRDVRFSCCHVAYCIELVSITALRTNAIVLYLMHSCDCRVAVCLRAVPRFRRSEQVARRCLRVRCQSLYETSHATQSSIAGV